MSGSLPKIRPFARGRGLTVGTYFTRDLNDPYEGVTFRKVDAVIRDWETKAETFRQNGFEVTAEHTDTNAAVIASRYARGTLGTPERESSIRQIVGRVVNTLTDWGVKGGYFATNKDAIVFHEELTRILITRKAAFNSPVWFNLGVVGSRPQASACYCLSLDDTMESILDHCKIQGMVFKFGSGAGANVSKIRSKRETMSGGGRPSGPLSFMSGLDKFAGVIKSGGKVRRAALLRVMNEDHPDILDYVWCKVHEEKKAAALIAGGFSGGFEGEAYSSVDYQNANNTCKVSDRTMAALKYGREHTILLTARTTGEVLGTLPAKDLMEQIADAAWQCGDPGLHFDSIERCNKVPSLGKIWTSNPCRRVTDHVLTPDGIRQILSMKVGDKIWTGKRWAPIATMAITGVKDVFAYKTTAGIFHGTENHHVFQAGSKIEIKDADALDIVRGPRFKPVDDFDTRAIMDGMVMGDGTVHNDHVHLMIGQNDGDYFDSEVNDLIGKVYSKPYTYYVETSLQPCEVPYTYLRKVPDRFKYATPNVVRSFLRGLYTANGSIVGGARVTLKAASELMIRDVQVMLSSLGIRSYVTTNKENNVQFLNGEYRCKKSYDLNITTDRTLFRDMIGFIQGYKTKRLDQICASIGPSDKPNKTTYEIMETVRIGTEPVMDITVDAPEHAYWSDGLLVSNCSEFLHIDDTSCNLASLNLREFQNEDGTLDIEAYQAAIRILILAMEIIVDNAHYPTERIRHLTRLTRPLGLGYCNLGAFLMAAGLPYDSREARTLAFGITSLLTATAYHRSAEIARDHGGPFTVYPENRGTMLSILETYAQSATEAGKTRAHVQAVDEVLAGVLEQTWAEALDLGRVYGYRNDESTCLAPTGTIQFLMAADTTGCEPDIALVKYKTLAGGGMLKIVNRVVGAALRKLGYEAEDVDAILAHVQKSDTIEGAPGFKAEHLPVFDCAFKALLGDRFISWRGHVEMMAALQEGVSMAISKTVNMPNSATKEDVLAAYVLAWDLGVKALAVFRDGSKGVQVVSTGTGEAKVGGLAPDPPTALPRAARTMSGSRTKIEIGGMDGYVRTSHDADGRIVEVFLTFTKHGSTVGGLMDALAIMISKDLRRGVALSEIMDSIRWGSFVPQGWATIETSDGKSENMPSSSIVNAVCTWLMAEYPDGVWVGIANNPGAKILHQSVTLPMTKAADGPAPKFCGKCGAVKHPNGPRCWTCSGCGDKEGGCG